MEMSPIPGDICASERFGAKFGMTFGPPKGPIWVEFLPSDAVK